MFAFLKTNLFFKDKVIFSNLIISLALALFSLIWLYFKITPTAEPIALHYTIYLGIDFIGPWYHVFMFPLAGFIVLIVNFSLAYRTYLDTKILAILLALTSSIIQFILAITSILVVLLNR
jgi:hypothetical protein